MLVEKVLFESDFVPGENMKTFFSHLSYDFEFIILNYILCKIIIQLYVPNNYSSKNHNKKTSQLANCFAKYVRTF